MEIEELQETVNSAPVGRVERELAEREVADLSLTSSLFFLPALSSPYPRLESLFTGHHEL